MSEKKWEEEYCGYFNMQTEKTLFEETLSILQRATKAREVAEVVARLFGVSRIHSDHVVTKEFIEILIGVATNLKSGRSVNNVREHINKMIIRDKWRQREKELCQDSTCIVNDKFITINVPFTFDREQFELLQRIIHQMDMELSRVMFKHFDGNPDTEHDTCQISDTPDRILSLLCRIREEVGEDALSDIRYSAPSDGFEREHLTLQQTIQMVDKAWD